jgi:hypothetical protein
MLFSSFADAGKVTSDNRKISLSLVVSVLLYKVVTFENFRQVLKFVQPIKAQNYLRKKFSKKNSTKNFREKV